MMEEDPKLLDALSRVQGIHSVSYDPFQGEHPGQISTRLPTGVRSTEDPMASHLRIDTEAMKKDRELFDHNVGLVKAYPNMRRADTTGPTSKVAEHFINHVKDNLLYIYDRVPQDIKQRSSLWYDGSRRLVEARAKEHGLPDTSVAGVYAALSPQKDWFQNVNLGDRLMHIHKYAQNERWSKDMDKTAARIYGKPENQPGIKAIRGKRLADLEPGSTEKAMWMRTFDEAHHDRSYPVVNPEGDFGPIVTTQKGTNQPAAWGSNPTISKGIRSIESGGNKAVISPAMGQMHKVRNFYNNILHPNSLHGDVTIDTHAVAAGLLRPLGGNSLEVAHNLATSPAEPGLPRHSGSSLLGVHGTYGLYADAYRRAAAERGVLPRQMQSVTWEAVRGLFPKSEKAGYVAGVDNIWHNYRSGKISLDQAREAVVRLAGGFRPPEWYRHG